MKIGNLSKWLFLLAALITGFGWVPIGQATAQTFTTLHNFNNDDYYPVGGLISSGSTLYGTTQGGGSQNSGTVYAINTDGTGFTNLYSFAYSDGEYPQAGLILSGNILYGTTSIVETTFDTNCSGTVFAVHTDGTGFTTLHSFTPLGLYRYATNSDGAWPTTAGLFLSGDTLYGTAYFGGSSGNGTVFALNTDGTGFTNLYNFPAGTNQGLPNAVILSGDTLYGTTYLGGTNGVGSVFALKIHGAYFTILHSFATSDGGGPLGGLILSGNTLYGTTAGGGTNGTGTVFAVNTDGTGFTDLHSFAAGSGDDYFYGWSTDFTNSDGAGPWATLILSGNTLYGTTQCGGTNASGTVFAVNTDGTGFTNLHSFTGVSGPSSTNSDGIWPQAGLILSGDALYGTAVNGGVWGCGTVFRLSFGSVSVPQLTIVPSGPYVILTWPTNTIGFTLQSTTSLGSSAVWSTNSLAPVVVNGQNVVTNSITGKQQFFRLSQ
jgi:uncharacterized repeat protein (TIGR03803 family)